jgi:hypothetical protein
MSIEFDSPPPLSLETLEGEARRETRYRLNQAAYDVKRLASFRRVLGITLVVVQTPVLVFSRSTDPTVKRLLVALAIIWLALVLPMMRVLFVEWHNRLLLERLTARVHGERGRSSGPFRP